MGDGETQHREYGNNYVIGAGGVVVGEWNHYVYTRENTMHRVWVNGKKERVVIIELLVTRVVITFTLVVTRQVIL